jgi:formamidopyrimidine-DNA glycosylase
MPELPEVEALATFLRDKAIGRTVTRVDVVAISALKTFKPPITALYGRTLTAVGRHGKFLDLTCAAEGESDLHFVIHLARAGWLRWSEGLTETPPRPGKGPLALRVHLGDGVGFNLTEAGTQKRLAAYVVDEILHAAKLSPFKPASSLSDEELERVYAAIRDVLTDAAKRSEGLAAKDLKAEKKDNLAVHGRTGLPCPVCGDTVREVSFADKSLQYCPTCQTGGKPLADRRLSKLLK